MMSPTRLCTFRLGGMLLGLPVSDVQEIVRASAITPVPLAPPLVRGLVNLRGQVLPAIDLRWRLGMERAGSEPGIHVILSRDGELISLPVDSIDDVMNLADHRRLPAPETLDGPLRDSCRAAWDLADELLLELDPERLLVFREGETVPTEQAGGRG
jgi:purine-binding chemotaxis protein CheW